MAVALHEIIVDRLLNRPPILEATRVCGFTNSDVARLLGCTPMQVNDWVKGRRPIPPVKHYALAILMFSMIGMIGRAAKGTHAARAKLLENTVRGWARLALDDAFQVGCEIPDHVPEGDARDLLRLSLIALEGDGPKIPEHIVDEGIALADQMLRKLGGSWL